MFTFLTSLFSGGTVKALTALASEAIETDKESAEAKALFVKVLDPNGTMRRQLSTFASIAFGYYLLVMSVLIFMTAFGDGSGQAQVAATMMKELFLPVLAAWTTITSASFGVNATNSFKGRP